MRVQRKTTPANRLQELRLGVLERIRDETDIQLQEQLARALSVSSPMVSVVLRGKANFRLPEALKLRELCPAIGVGWVYFLSPQVHDDLISAIEDSRRSDARPKPR